MRRVGSEWVGLFHLPRCSRDTTETQTLRSSPVFSIRHKYVQATCKDKVWGKDVLNRKIQKKKTVEAVVPLERKVSLVESDGWRKCLGPRRFSSSFQSLSTNRIIRVWTQKRQRKRKALVYVSVCVVERSFANFSRWVFYPQERQLHSALHSHNKRARRMLMRKKHSSFGSTNKGVESMKERRSSWDN